MENQVIVLLISKKEVKEKHKTLFQFLEDCCDSVTGQRLLHVHDMCRLPFPLLMVYYGWVPAWCGDTGHESTVRRLEWIGQWSELPIMFNHMVGPTKDKNNIYQSYSYQSHCILFWVQMVRSGTYMNLNALSLTSYINYTCLAKKI